MNDRFFVCRGRSLESIGENLHVARWPVKLIDWLSCVVCILRNERKGGGRGCISRLNSFRRINMYTYTFISISRRKEKKKKGRKNGLASYWVCGVLLLLLLLLLLLFFFLFDCCCCLGVSFVCVFFLSSFAPLFFSFFFFFSSFFFFSFFLFLFSRVIIVDVVFNSNKTLTRW